LSQESAIMIHRTLIALLLLGTALGARAFPTLTLTAPDLAGAPGQTVGWGFSLDNSGTALDLLVTGVWADGDLGSGVLGAFADAIASWSLPDGLTVKGGELYTGSFPATALATFAIDAASAAPGDWVSGTIHLDYELYQGPDWQDSGTLDASARVTVVAAPVPATATLLALGLAGLAGRRRAGRA
jgi:hypothetical protein